MTLSVVATATCAAIGVVFVLLVAFFSRQRGWRMVETVLPAFVFQGCLQFVSALLWWSLEATGNSLVWFVTYELICCLLLFRLIYRSQVRKKEKR